MSETDSPEVRKSSGENAASVHANFKSTNSRISIQSDVTMSEDNTEQNVEENVFTLDTNSQSLSVTSEENPRREDRGSTINSDMSGSCSTLQNERQDGEIESSLEQSKKQQMSVTFRQELLRVSQLKADSRIGLEVAKMTEPNFDLVQLLGRALPHIIPNVTLSKREVGVVLLKVGVVI